jgi:hypothetical protein
VCTAAPECSQFFGKKRSNHEQQFGNQSLRLPRKLPGYGLMRRQLAMKKDGQYGLNAQDSNPMVNFA